ncbi:PilX N-terminal domain-containing pilus assembly protein [Roseateles saccharophilus]|uniref:PilX-like prepilin protein n=2 Tax=Roseateles saccharophilus TaxID=304 RepID=A0A4R3UQE8_ROSSA|nr:hypothetical protein [Roseateles saccharophilus]TCU93242.1 hypothetical protein EV671_101940 [Roseateles saccharophilus]
MVLFLVMALLAAYANRGLLFEQRIAGSYARAALSQEVAEGGIEWALAQLNGPAIDANCQPLAVGGQRFADKYLQINPSDRSIVLTKLNYAPIFADCTRDNANAGWACRCPAINTRVPPAAAGGTDLIPSFGIRAIAGSRGGTIQLISTGCTDSVVDNCAGSNASSRSTSQWAMVRFNSTIALVSAVRTPPATPLVVKGNLDMTGAGLGLHNTDPRSAGLLLDIGGSWSGMNNARMQSVPGTDPSQASIQNDQALSAAPDVFKMFMGATPTRYFQHPSLRTVTCSGDCSNALQTAYNAGSRILWVAGSMSFSSNKTIGSPGDPVLIIADGNISLDGPFILNGMLVATGNLSWNNAGGATLLINGIVLVGGSMQTSGAMDIAYQQAIADQLTNRMGSFVRVPGGWVDNY